MMQRHIPAIPRAQFLFLWLSMTVSPPIHGCPWLVCLSVTSTMNKKYRSIYRQNNYTAKRKETIKKDNPLPHQIKTNQNIRHVHFFFYKS